MDECPNCHEGEPEDGVRRVYKCVKCDFEGCYAKDASCCWELNEPCPECGESYSLTSWEFVDFVTADDD